VSRRRPRVAERPVSKCTVADIRYGLEEPTSNRKCCTEDAVPVTAAPNLVPLPVPRAVADSHPNSYYRIGEAANPGPVNLACLDDPDEDPFQHLHFDAVNPPMETDAERAAKEAVDMMFEPRTIRIADYIDAPDWHTNPKTEMYGPTNATSKQRRAKDKIEFETCNSTGWTALLHRLQYSQAQVILSQEHHVREDLIKEKSDQALNLGWKSLWSPANCTADNEDNRCTSGGVAIFVRKYFGLVEFEDEGVKRASLEPGRLVVGKFSAPGLGSIAVYSAYCLCGVGLNHTNKDLIGKVHEFNAMHELPWLCGADWNMQPSDLSESGLLSVMKAKIAAPEDPTCITPSSLRTIDFFLVDEQLFDGLEHPEVIEDAVTRPHRPTQTAIKADLKKAKVMNSTPESRSHSPVTPRDAAHAHVLSMVSMRGEGEVHPSRPPIWGAERMAALRERVLAKASTKGQ